MRFIQLISLLFALQVLSACTLDFDKFKPSGGSPHDKDGGNDDDAGGVALAGAPCDDEDARACPGHASQQTLVCQSGKWQSGASCDDDERCDSRNGDTLGHCVKIPSECKDKDPSAQFCAGDAVRTCNADLVAFDDVACGTFGTCMDNTGGAQCVCAPGHAHDSDGSCSATGGGDGGTGGSGGNGAGGTGGSGTKNKPPVVSVLFPPPGVTDHNAMIVRGTVSDPDGDKITKLTVNGKAAKLSADGTFKVSVPLALGAHALALHVEDDAGSKDDTDGPEIERLGYMFQSAADMVLDSANHRVIALDGANDAIVAISLEDGVRTVIVPPSTTPVGRVSMDLDAAHNRVIVAETSPGAVAWIDLATGKRTLISGTSNNGPAMIPHAVVLDPIVTNRAFVTADGNDDTYSSNVVLAVDLTSGDRVKYSQPGAYPTINFGRCNDIVYDQARGQLLMVSPDGLISVKVANDSSAGTLNMIASGVNRAMQAGYGADFFNPWHMTLDGDRLIVFGGEYTNIAGPCVFEFDFATGRIHELAALALGKDPQPPTLNQYSSPGVYDPSTGDALYLDLTGRLLRARLAPGDREYVSQALYGAGPLFERPVSITVDSTRKHWVVADEDLNALIAVDQANGDRSLISDASHGSGAAFATLVAVEFHADSNNDEILALDDTHLWSVDPISGDRTVVSSDDTAFHGATDMVVDNTRVLVVGCFGNSYPCAPQVMAVDLATGNRTVISDLNTGTGTLPGPNTPFTGIVARNGKFLVSGPDILLEVDGSNGNRTVVSNDTNDGPALQNIQGVALDTYEDRAVLINNYTELVAVDMVSGDREELTDWSNTKQGPSPSAIGDVVEDAAGHRLIVAEGQGETTAGLIAVHLADRKRSLVSEQGHGDWTGFAMVLDPKTHQLYAGLAGANGAGATVVALDTRTSERTTISDDSDNGGKILWTSPTGLALDAKGKRLFGVNFFFVNPNSLLAIDLDDGTQSVVSDANKGGGVAWTAPFDVAWEPASSRVMIANPALPAIIAVDPTSGERVAFSGGPAGSGAAFTRPISLAIDEDNARMLVVDMKDIIAVDLDSGDRTPFSGTGAGSGPDFVGPSRVVVDPIGKRAIVLDIGSTNPPVPPTLVEVSLDDGTRSVLATLPERWFQNVALSFLEPAFAFDGATETAYVAQLYAFDVTTGESISIAGHAK